MFVRSGFPFNYDTNKASDDSGLGCQDESLAKDSFRKESDINTIVKNFTKTGQLPLNVKAPTYASFDDVFDFHTAMQSVREATEAFMMLPAEIRARFHNDPQELVEFASNEDNLAEAEKMGFLVQPQIVPEKIAKVEIVGPLPATDSTGDKPKPAESAASKKPNN